MYIEYNVTQDKWFILYPDGSKAWPDGYKTHGWAVRILNFLKNS